MAHTKSLKIRMANRVAFSPDGAWLVATTNKAVHFWDMATRKKAFESKPFKNPMHIAFSPSGDRLVAKSTSGQIVLIDPTSGQVLRDFDNTTEGAGTNVCFSGDGEFLVDGSWTGLVTIRDTSSGKVVFQESYQNERINAVHRSPDGQRWYLVHMLAGMDPCYVAIRGWPFVAGTREVIDEPFPFTNRSILSADGRLLAIVHGAPPIRLVVVDTSDGRVVKVMRDKTGGGAGGVAWSPDGKLFARVQKDQVVVFATPDYKKLVEIPTKYPSDVAFSPTGEHLAVGSWSAGEVHLLATILD